MPALFHSGAVILAFLSLLILTTPRAEAAQRRDIRDLPANLQPPHGVQAKIGARLHQGFYVIDHDREATASAVRKFARVSAKGHNNNISFRGSMTNDRSITSGIHIDWDIDGTLEEHFLFMEGAFGRLEVGAPYAVTEQLHYTIPEFIPGNSIDYPWLINIARVSANTATFIRFADTAYKASFYTPRLFGLRVAFSYTPTLSREVAEGNNGFAAPAKEDTTQDNIYLLALNFRRPLARDLDAGVSLSYAQAKGVLPSRDAQSIATGLNILWRGFHLGAAYKVLHNIFAPGGRDDVWTAGFSYRYGPYLSGIGWRMSERRGQGAKKTNWGIQTGMSYAAGENLRLGVDLQYIEDEDPDIAPARSLSAFSFGFVMGVDF